MRSALNQSKELLRSIRRIMRSTDLYSKQVAVEHGVTVPQLICLHTVVEKSELTVGDVARAVDLSQSTCVGILYRLEVKGLVTRVRDAGDRRKVRISPTPAGQVLCDAAPSLLQTALLDKFEALDEPAQDSLVQALRKIVYMMEIGHIDAAPVLETGVQLHVGPATESAEPVVPPVRTDAARQERGARDRR